MLSILCLKHTQMFRNMVKKWSVVTWSPALLAARRICWSWSWLFWPYSFSISPSIQKMDCSHLEGKSLVTLSSYTGLDNFLFFFILLQLYMYCSWTALRWGVVALPPLLLVRFFFIISQPCLSLFCTAMCSAVRSSLLHTSSSAQLEMTCQHTMDNAICVKHTNTEVGMEWICAAGC